MTKTLLGTITVFFLGGLSPTFGAPVLFMADGETNAIYTVDVNSGAASLVGPMGFESGFVGLGYDSLEGDLLMTSSINGNSPGASVLYRVNQQSGAANQIGNTGIANLTGLAFDPNRQTMFGGSGNNDALYSINTNTGATTLVGSFGVNVGGHGLAYASDTDTLLMTDFATDTLYSVNPDTGVATSIGATLKTGVVALAFDHETSTLYGVDANSDELLRFNRDTGLATPIGFLGVDVFNVGLAFTTTVVPEPTSFFFCCSIGWLSLMRRRR
ncbi:MAG: hypothetical protein AAFX06_27930 [Planctomycetota bacterium]